MKHFLIALLAFMCLGVLAGAENQQPPQKKEAREVALTPDVANTVTTLKRDFEAANAARLLAESQMNTARNGIAAQFNRFCAKQKLDPDAYEWNDDLSGIRKKTEKP